MSITIAVAGASGYAGGEILRLLLAHPAHRSGELRIGAITGSSTVGRRVGGIMPHLPPLADREIAETSAETLADHDVVFLGLPHGHSAAIAAELGGAAADAADGPIIIDCAADHRLGDAAEWGRYYGGDHPGAWTYGLPEIPGQRARIRASRRIAVPGCFPTGATIAALPALDAGLVRPDLAITSITGTSGAGKKASVPMLGSEVMGNLRAYSTAGRHRHTAEFLQNLGPFAPGGAGALRVSFTPVLAPAARGILTVVSAPLADGGVTGEDARTAYADRYADEPFVRVLAGAEQPQTKSVIGANTVQLQVEVDERAGRLLVTGVIDNLAKGTGGAAVQCMNLALGLEETAGLPECGLAP